MCGARVCGVEGGGIPRSHAGEGVGRVCAREGGRVVVGLRVVWEGAGGGRLTRSAAGRLTAHGCVCAGGGRSSGRAGSVLDCVAGRLTAMAPFVGLQGAWWRRCAPGWTPPLTPRTCRSSRWARWGSRTPQLLSSSPDSAAGLQTPPTTSPCTCARMHLPAPPPLPTPSPLTHAPGAGGAPAPAAEGGQVQRPQRPPPQPRGRVQPAPGGHEGAAPGAHRNLPRQAGPGGGGEGGGGLCS